MNSDFYSVSNSNALKTVKVLLSYPLNNWVSQYFVRTRSYHSELEFITKSYHILECNRDSITSKEYEAFDRYLIGLKLSALDNLNRWNDYIAFYDYVRNNKAYVTKYSKFKDYPDINAFVLYEDLNYKYVHFLYGFRRYDIIKRKLKRHTSGKTTNHLKKHQQDKLAEVEYQKRLDEMYYCFWRIANSQNRPGRM